MEIWKDIEGYEGYYQISNRGNVKSLTRQVEYIAFGKLQTRMQYGKVLKQSICSSGYPIVHLYKDQERQNIMIHRLVAIYFVPRIIDKEFVNHKDGDKFNNDFENLEWVTKSENTIHAIDNGLLKKAGEDCNLAKLTETQALEIISLRKFGKGKYFAKDIAAKYNLSEKYVSELGASENKWSRLRQNVSEKDFYEIYLRITENWEPSKYYKTPSKHNISDDVKQEILHRRGNGDRVVDIANDFNLPQKFVSWFTRKHLSLE